MATINETYEERSVNSVRINDRLVDVSKKTGLHLSYIIECCLTYFSRLSDEEKMRFLVNNDPEKVEADELMDPTFNYADMAIEKAKQSLGNKQSVRTSTKLLIAMGLTLLLALLFSGKDSK